jgi:MYXO-CTERM domain-containing protein
MRPQQAAVRPLAVRAVELAQPAVKLRGAKGGAPPAPNLPDPGTAESNACSMGGPSDRWGPFGTTLALGVAFLTTRRRRRH